jgi:hypothetical protein
MMNRSISHIDFLWTDIYSSNAKWINTFVCYSNSFVECNTTRWPPAKPIVKFSVSRRRGGKVPELNKHRLLIYGDSHTSPANIFALCSRSALWAQTSLGTDKLGHRQAWAQTSLGTDKRGHRQAWAQTSVGTDKPNIFIQHIPSFSKSFQKLRTFSYRRLCNFLNSAVELWMNICLMTLPQVTVAS